MKRSIAGISAILVLASSLCGCAGKHKYTNSNEGTPDSPQNIATTELVEVDAPAQKSESAEDAITELYGIIYSQDGGDGFYRYMYPNAVSDYLRSQNTYTNYIQQYNEGQNAYISLMDHIPAIKAIASCTPLTDEQIEAAYVYITVNSKALYPDFSESMISITKGYDLKMAITDDTGNDAVDYACMIWIDGEGWKYIGRSANSMVKAIDEYKSTLTT